MTGLTVAVTGATSDFAAALLPVLLDDPAITAVVGLGRRAPRVHHAKLRHVSADIRSPELESIFTGCDVVIHLAFVVEEQRDKAAIHEVNIEGTRNTVECAHRAGVRSMVVASSVSAYGREDLPVPVTEDEFPTADPSRYYFFDKAEVEHFVEWWLRRHPGEMSIALLRPTYVVGSHFANDGIDTLTQPVVAFPDPRRSHYQFLHQDDMADAFHRAVHERLDGPWNLGPRDWLSVAELGAMQGQLVLNVPLRLLRTAVNVAYALRLLPFSSHWISSGEAAVDSSALERRTGWAPTMSSAEAAAVMILLAGRPVVTRHHAPQRHVVCESALQAATARVRAWGDVDPAVADLTSRLDAGLDRCEHRRVDIPTGAVHVEIHRADDGSTVVVLPAPRGLHARYLTALGRAIADLGATAVLVDLPGHGLSTGRRGRTSRRAEREALRAVTAEFPTDDVVVVRHRRGSRRDSLAAVPGADGLLRARSGVRLPVRRSEEGHTTTRLPRVRTVRLPRRAGMRTGDGQARALAAISRVVTARTRSAAPSPARRATAS
ncbi:NAD-dependent epimerase/dehydratase family protein [Rhodococcoides corynebacterioides]|uniref:NAD-dependent epimerase/dehydratase family protein n=1 Tax=Rhodococcoides corynebacterioides TaxID=53972 RepID=A0ABS7P868_9NOCA|nr:NAD-dependent epimerase/dehydratase family protein [Rhodococcus corynebacterioides]MBY6367824.1 NAD-dependent epimerase/dehydratase family protein [Rhodococcus corynebacterioides]MBY6408305.1 NAD-dependent epimerase/dehydratase family protein [Rhodococcus corynebacterioides]